MKKFLKNKGSDVNFVKDVIREAAIAKYISEPEDWFYYQYLRNMTVHTYEEDEAELIIVISERFSDSVKEFLKNIGVPESGYSA